MKDGVQSALPALEQAMKEQRRFLRNDLGVYLENRASRFRFELFLQFKRLAGDGSQIDEDAARLRYAIRRRKTKGGRRLTVEQEIKKRKAARGFLAQSFRMRRWKRSKKGQNSTIDQKGSRGRRGVLGRTILRTAKGEKSPYVEIGSFLSGVFAVNQERRIVEKAEAAQVADIGVYMARKMDQRNAQIYKRVMKAVKV